MTAKFFLLPANTKLWNESAFIDFLLANRDRPIELDTIHEGPCLTACGVYQLLDQFDCQDVTIITSNPLEVHDRYRIEYITLFSFFETTPTDYSAYHRWDQSCVFGCFYNRPLWYRIGLAAKLQHDYEPISLINVRCNPNEVDQRELFELHELFVNAPDSLQKFATVFPTWPVQLEQSDEYTINNNTTGHTDQLASFYPNILIDVVCETFVAGRTFFITEKTVRPMLMKKPMIVMGSENCLLYLRQMGFKTFYDFWDEDYDGYQGKERFSRILHLINDLSKKSIKELETMYWDMQYILDHNYNLLLTQQYKKQITYVK